MRMAMYYANHDLRLEERPIPAIGPGEALVKIHASGICGSDVMEWYRRDKVPLVLGHEISGEIMEIGEGVRTFRPGDRVVATHHVPCCTCHWCLSGHETVCDTLLSGTHFDPGGFCEYVRLPGINLERGTWKIAANTGYDAATFVEPLACVLRGQNRVNLRPGASVLVLGCGISGLLHVHLAASNGAGLIVATDINEYRCHAAMRFGATATIPADQDVPSRFRELNKDRGAGVVIVCALAEQAFHQAFAAVDRGGTILLFAPTREGVTIPLSINQTFWRRDVTITTTYAGSPADCAAALSLIEHGRVQVEEMISHRLGLAEIGQGFKLVAEARESLKVIIRPQE